MGEPSSLGNSGWGRSISGFCGGRVGDCGSWRVGGHGEKVGLSSGNWSRVGPLMGNCSSIPSFGSSCHSSVIMSIFDGAFNQILPQLLVCLFVSLFGSSASGDTESKRLVS